MTLRAPGVRRPAFLALCLLLASACSLPAHPEGLPPLPQAPDTLAWSEVGEWTFTADGVAGNPFDVEMVATFTHEDGATVEAPAFHAGGGEWRVRFPALRLGRWHFETRSAVPALDGHEGEVRVEPGADDAQGFLRARGATLVVPVANGHSERGVLYDVYMPSTDTFDVLSDLPRNPGARGARIEALLDEAAANGFPALLVRVYNAWFDFEAQGHDEHDRVNPDPYTFEVLEDFVRRAHARGMYVHLWAWGDEERGWTPIGVGGINGEPDTRLQRYIGARLGPLPGWTMSYGFDLNEWVEPEEVRRWAAALHRAAPATPLVTAREVEHDEDDAFVLGADKLDLFSTDDRPDDDFYALARERLAGGRPVLFERRFLHGRDGVWDADTTRRARWQFAMAGGAGAIWGPGFEDAGPYPNAGQLRVHARFWESHFRPTLEPASPADARAADGVTLRTPDRDLVITYQEATDAVTLDLAGVPPGRSIEAVDTRAETYEEIDVGSLEGGTPTWRAPHASDWVVVTRAE